jgi:hypothetical protein
LEGSASACRRGIAARCLVAGTLLLAALAVAQGVRADPGPADDAAVAAEAGDSQGAAADDDAGGPGHAAEAPGYDDPPGSSGDAPGHDDPPGNSGDALGHQDDQGPTAESDQGASVGQHAGAAASAEQQDVDNTAVTVRVDEPGNGKKVGQENRAAADADASTASAVDGGPGATVAQASEADASATQSDVSNTSIVVRVGSAGDDEGVSQANLATGSAAATTLSDQPASAVADATALATQDGVANTAVSVRVFSPGDDGPIDQLNAASAAAQASPGGTEAVDARQDDARNTSVSIRVESPGAAPAPVQENRVTTTSSGDDGAGPSNGVAVALAGNATNTVLTVAVGGTSLDRPGAAGLQVWVWTWVWQRDETQALAGLAAPEPDSWSWSWDGTGIGTATPRGSVTSRAADEDEQGREGSLEWSWDWTRAGIPGWTWGWDRQLTLSCASCIWIWNWSWSWIGQPDADAVPPAGPVTPGPPAQLNAVTAQAAATTTSLVAQSALQEASGASTQYAGQLVDVAQGASAVATARQTKASSIAWDGEAGQANVVSSAAGADLTGAVRQALEQSLDSSGPAHVDQWGGQQADLVQVGGAKASAAQHGALLLGPGSHVSNGAASAQTTAAVAQRLAQDALATGGTVSQWAGQLAIVAQAAEATTTVAQTGSVRSRRVGGAALASAQADDLALVAQAAEQSAARTGQLGSQSAAQLAYAGQDASASAVTAQTAGAATLSEARSGAESLTRAEILQEASQSANGASVVVQDLLQQAIVVQSAVASSTSGGGNAGRASVVDCAVVQQGATQSFAAGPARPEVPADTAFCLPPAAPSSSSPVVIGSPTAAGGGEPAVAHEAGAGEITVAVQPPVAEGGTVARKAPVAGRSVDVSIARGAVGRNRWSPSASSALAPAGVVPGHTQLSAPPFPQARIDTRPGSHAVTGDAGREPPLPPAGDPPMWVSALAAAASGGGASGIAAILFAFALAAPLLLRAPEGSAVRRPTDVLARFDVPV